MDMIAEHGSTSKTGKTFFTTLEMSYAYGQVKLGAHTAKHCIFQILGGEATGVYRVFSGFYGSTAMSTEFQRIIDLTLAGFTNTYAFIDNILLVTYGTEDEHLEKITEVPRRLDENNINLKVDKKIATGDNEWVGYEL